MTDPADAESDTESRGRDGDERGGESVAAAVARAVGGVEGVTGLHGGVFGEIATYLPGGRVSGVRLNEDGGEVHVIVELGHDVRAVAERASQIATQIAGVQIDVTVEDVSMPTHSGVDRRVSSDRIESDHGTAEVKNDG